jgi:hypothetical protein
MKKKFKETGFGKFLNKVIKKVPTIAGDVLEVATSGNPVKTAISKVGDLLKGSSESDEKAKELLEEFERFKLSWEKEMYELDIKLFSMEVEDRKSARDKYINSDTTVADKLAVSIMGRNIVFIFCLIAFQILFSVGTVLFLLNQVEDLQVAVTIGTSLGSVIGGAVGTVVGSLLQERNSVVGFHFGSSSSINKKREP